MEKGAFGSPSTTVAKVTLRTLQQRFELFLFHVFRLGSYRLHFWSHQRKLNFYESSLFQISSSLSRLSHHNMLSPPPPSSILYDSDTSSRTKRKKVTFQENVQQHLCLVENKSKPYFNKDAPPKVSFVLLSNNFRRIFPG